MQEEFRNCADISIGYPEPPSTTTTPVTKTTIPSSDAKKGTLNTPLVGWSDSRYLKGHMSTSSAINPGLKNRVSTGSKLPYTKLGKVTIDTDLPEMDRTMTQQGAGASSKGDVRDYIFRVTRIEEALSLLDDTERVLTGLDTNLAEGGAANNKMPGTHYVKLYAGLVWTRKKISHLEKLIGKIVSRLSLVGSTRRQIRKHNNNDGVYLSEFKANSAVVKDKIQVDDKGNARINTRIIKPTSIKEVNRVGKSSQDQSITIQPRSKIGKVANNIVYSNKHVTNPQLSKRITVLHTKTYNSVTSRPVKVQPSTMFTKSTKASAKTESVYSLKEFRRNDNILNQVNKGSTQAAKTTLVNKFPVVDSWALRTTSIPRDLTGHSNNIADLSSKSLLKSNRVVPPNALPWSPEKMPEPVPITRTVTMAHTTNSVKDRKPQTTNAVKDRKSHTTNSVKDMIAHATNSVKDMQAHATNSVKDMNSLKTNSVKVRKSHKTNSVKDMIAHATNSVKDMQAHATNSVKDMNYQKTNSVKVRKSHTASSVKDRKSHTANSVKDMKAHTTKSVKDRKSHTTNLVKNRKSYTTYSVKDLKARTNNSVKNMKAHTTNSVKDMKARTTNSVEDMKAHTTNSVKDMKVRTTNSVEDMKSHTTYPVKNRKSHTTYSVKDMKDHTTNSAKDMKSHRKHSVKDMNSQNMKSRTQNSFKDIKSRTTNSVKDMKPHTTRNYIKPTFRLKTRKTNALNNYNPKAVVKEMLPTLGALGLTGIPGVSENSRMAPTVVKTMRKINKISRGKKLTLTKWQLAELRNRILHQEYIRANMQRHRENGNSLLAKR